MVYLLPSGISELCFDLPGLSGAVSLRFSGWHPAIINAQITKADIFFAIEYSSNEYQIYIGETDREIFFDKVKQSDDRKNLYRCSMMRMILIRCRQRILR